MSIRVLHLSSCEKFLPDYVKFVSDNFNVANHHFHLTIGIAQERLNEIPNVSIEKKGLINKVLHYVLALVKMRQAEKIIIHGLFDNNILLMLLLMPWLCKKVYWVIWGADLYLYEATDKSVKWKIREAVRRRVIKNIGHLVTYIPGDIELVRRWYDNKGRYHECTLYPSNLYRDCKRPSADNPELRIQVGNSADPANNHFDALEKLKAIANVDFKAYVPLSYGDKAHATKVINLGYETFGDKFVPLTEMQPLDDYIKFQNTLDIAIFNHKRQQAMGNTISLLGMGKTVYLRSDVTHWSFLQSIGLTVYDIEKDAITKGEPEALENNKKRVRTYFSIENLTRQWSSIFEV